MYTFQQTDFIYNVFKLYLQLISKFNASVNEIALDSWIDEITIIFYYDVLVLFSNYVLRRDLLQSLYG